MPKTEPVHPVAARASFLDRPALMILIASVSIAVISLFATGLVSF